MDFSDNARFGLENEISEAVSEYYDLLFDNVKEYIGMNRGELKEYEAEDAELREKLENVNIGEAERKTLIENRKNALEMIENLREFLDSSLAIEVGIKISGEMLDDNEPDLADRFNAAPAAEKYACLTARYMDEYRRDLAPRSDSPCVDADAFRHGAEKVRELFPKLAEQYEEHKREEYKKLLAVDPVRLHDDLMLHYSLAHVADAGRRLLELRHDRDALQSGLREHEEAKPGWLKNMATLGNAGKAWKNGRETLTREIAERDGEMAELRKLREDLGEERFSGAVVEYARGEVSSRHPEVVAAHDQHMAKLWKQENEARLEMREAKRAERDGCDDTTRDDGISR